jgi:hypothetical protein
VEEVEPPGHESRNGSKMPAVTAGLHALAVKDCKEDGGHGDGQHEDEEDLDAID